MFQKIKRIKNTALLSIVRRCACSCWMTRECVGATQAHHIKTKGSGGDDVEENLMPLCVLHHSMFHASGVETFLRLKWVVLSFLNRAKLIAHIKKIPLHEAMEIIHKGDHEYADIQDGKNNSVRLRLNRRH